MVRAKTLLMRFSYLFLLRPTLIDRYSIVEGPALHIDKYGFGKIVIDGKKYEKDVIITPRGEVKYWRRVKGHEVYVKDLEPVESEGFNVLIIGTGYFGMVRVLSEVKEWAERRGVRMVAVPTKEACKMYNEMSGEKRIIAALHLTC